MVGTGYQRDQQMWLKYINGNPFLLYIDRGVLMGRQIFDKEEEMLLILKYGKA